MFKLKIKIKNKNYNQFKFNDDENNKNIILKSKDYYFSQRKKINNLLGELYTKKLQAKVQTSTSNFPKIKSRYKRFL